MGTFDPFTPKESLFIYASAIDAVLSRESGPESLIEKLIIV